MSQARATSTGAAGTRKRSREYERERLPPNRLLGSGYFMGAYSGEHIAGTEFVIGIAFVSMGVSTGDLLLGLLIGNLLAVLSWALLCSPVATRARITIYWYLERLGGKSFSRLYNLLNGLIFAVISGAMITVSASAFRVLTDVPPQTGMLPTSASFILIALAVGAFTVFLTIKGFRLISNFASICAPWLGVMFVASGIVAIPVMAFQGAEQGVEGLPALLGEFVWTGQAADGSSPLSLWQIIAWAWGANLPMHLGMSDMSILRFARRARYGYASALGMFFGHYMAWACAGMMGAAAALMLNESLLNLDPGSVAFSVLGLSGLLAVVIAGWTTSIPSLYRAGLAFQSIFSAYSRTRVTLVTGVLTTLVACFPFFFMQWMNVLAYFIIPLSPVGAIIIAEHFILPRLNRRPFWREQLGVATNRAAFITWFACMGLAALLIASNVIHIFSVFLPVWCLALVLYSVLAWRMAPVHDDREDPWTRAYGPVEAPRELEEPEQSAPPQRPANWLLYISLACLIAILAAAFTVMLAPGPVTDAVDRFRLLIIVPTVLYFITAAGWLARRYRRQRPGTSQDVPITS